MFILCRNSWSLSQHSLGERQLRPGHSHRLNKHRKTTIHTHNHTYWQFRIINSPNLHDFGLWEETHEGMGRICKVHTVKTPKPSQHAGPTYNMFLPK